MPAAVVVVAHTTRRTEAEHLAHQVDAVETFTDDGTLGCEGNHRRAWAWHRAHTHTGWAVVLEDDALPIDSFGDHLDAALAAAPAPIVSLYLGTGYPPTRQNRIQRALDRLDDTTSWLLSDALLHAVGVAIRTDLLGRLTIPTGYPIDDALTRWARRRGHRIAYAVPSLVDHADTPTVIRNRRLRDKPRKAWRIGTRDTWTTQAAKL